MRPFPAALRQKVEGQFKASSLLSEIKWKCWSSTFRDLNYLEDYHSSLTTSKSIRSSSLSRNPRKCRSCFVKMHLDIRLAYIQHNTRRTQWSRLQHNLRSSSTASLVRENIYSAFDPKSFDSLFYLNRRASRYVEDLDISHCIA